MKLDELARQAGTSPRTVRYYVQRGLLPAPGFRGRDTAYGAEHLARLRAIRRMQERYLPLDAIEVELAGKSLAEIERLAEGGAPVSEPSPRSVVPTPPAVSPRPPPASGGAYRRPAERPLEGRAWLRFALGPGLELHLDEGADPATRALAEEILKQAARSSG
jgi:Ca-activated chloride channel family protein